MAELYFDTDDVIAACKQTIKRIHRIRKERVHSLRIKLMREKYKKWYCSIGRFFGVPKPKRADVFKNLDIFVSFDLHIAETSFSEREKFCCNLITVLEQYPRREIVLSLQESVSIDISYYLAKHKGKQSERQTG